MLNAAQRSRWLRTFAALAILVFIGFAGRYVQTPAVKQLSVGDAKALIDAGAVIIDVRGERAFGERRLPGAVNVPLKTLETAIPDWLLQAKDKPVILYCDDGLKNGPWATVILNNAGFTRAANLQTGIEGWAATGLPVAR